MTELPRGWKTVKVREAGRVQLGRQRSPEFHSGANMRPYLRVANVYEDELCLDDVMEMHFDDADVERYELHPGDILLNEGQSRELVGRPAMYHGELQGACFTNSLIRFQASQIVDPEFALHLFRHWMKQGDFQAIAQVTTNIAHLGAGRFGDMDFPVPPLAEQRRIGEKIRALTTRSRRAKELLDAIPDLIEHFRRSVLDAAFRGDLTVDWREKNPDVERADRLLMRIRAERRRRWEEAELAKMRAKGKVPADDRWKERYEEPTPVDAEGLPELPERWCWASFDELSTSLRGGLSTTAQSVPTPHPVLKSSAVRQGAIDYDDVSYLPKQGDESSYLHEGDLLFTRLSGTLAYVGNCAVVRGLEGRRLQYPDRIFRAEVLDLVNKDYVASSFGSQALRRRLEDGAKSTAGHQRISIIDIKSFAVPLAPVEEQDVIAARILAALERVSRTGLSLAASEKTLGDLDRAILAKAFRGELVPEDPTDEPVSVLLDRIHAERAAAATVPPSERPKASVKRPTMSNSDKKDAIKAAILKLSTDIFSFDQLKAQVTGDYDSLKESLFELLEEPTPVVRQVFDKQAKAMKLVRVRP